MPILTSNYKPKTFFKNSHCNTIYRAIFSKTSLQYQRKRVTTWDHDFIDLDYSTVNSKSIVLLIHGLEGSANSDYIKSTAKAINKAGIDSVSMNLRGCSEEDNLLLKTYHSGKTDDVSFVINHLNNQYNYTSIFIVGFSLGGNLTLKYLGENKVPNTVKGAVTISVPIDLTTAQAELSKFKNKIYTASFLRSMKKKMLQKAAKFPEFSLDKELLARASKFKHLEKQYTVPIFGFKSSEDYWLKASSKPFIKNIKVPTLLINALDDSFLSKECYPYNLAEEIPNFYLLTPKHGGHVGFIESLNPKKNTWLETTISKFIQQQL